MRGHNSIEIVKDGLPTDAGFTRNKAIDMSRSECRPSIVHSMGPSVNEKRFGLTDFYDKSTYLSKVRRPRNVIPFERYDKRQKSLIAKGGDNGIDLQGKSDAFYDPVQDVTFPRRDKKVPIIGK